MIYIIGIIVFILVLLACTILLIYYIRDEKNLSEVSEEQLIKFGKTYTKKEFEDKMFNQYSNILTNIQYENYLFLKDAVADDIYNQILLLVKNNREKNQQKVVSNIKKDFCKLISFTQTDGLEIAKLWIKYSSIEYVKSMTRELDENKQTIMIEKIIEGNKDQIINSEYIITFIKDISEVEDIICPNCGYQAHLLTSSSCLRCDMEIVSKKKHWVFLKEEPVNMKKKKD